MKRLFDIIFSFLGLILLLPVFVAVAVLIKYQDKGPVFISSKRIGKGFKPFNLYRFRTTIRGVLREKTFTSEGNSLRVTYLGNAIKKSGIDRLPQLWNVLKGDMSFIGPTPEIRKHVSKYRKDFKEILKVRPGIIDISSVGCCDEESILKTKDDPENYYIHVFLPERMKASKEYVKKASLLYDFNIVFFTVFKQLYPHRIILRIISTLTPYRRLIVVVMQIMVFIISNYLAFYIRFDAQIPPPHYNSFVEYIPILLLFRTIFLFSFSLDKGLWRYASIRDLFNIVLSISVGSLLFLFTTRYLLGDISYPRSIYVIDWFLNIFILWGMRLFRRIHERTNLQQMTKKRVIIFGAGDAAEMLIRDIEHSASYPYHVIGLIDDDLMKKGLKIRNVPIIGTTKDLPRIVEREDPEEFLVTIPSSTPSKLQGVIKRLRQFGLPIKMLPGLWGVLNGKYPLDKIEVLEPEDVLFREPVFKQNENLKTIFKDKKIMITGAGGSIGSELSRQLSFLSPKNLILFERHEESLYKINMELCSYNTTDSSFIIPVIADILDEKRVAEVMSRYRPEIVFHTAAYKHVPLMEDNTYEAFKTNVIGTRIVAEKARESGVERFVLISTDKAVNPVNVMGMTKKIAEDLIRYYSDNKSVKGWNSEVTPTATKYITVRFGNVLESSGSVVPLFKEQIKKGGPITITHPDIIRYFMTIPEAVDLVLQAVTMGNGGEVFVLDMGKPIKILDLAKRMISLYGYKPGIDIDITFIGLRPGEKLYEDLFNSAESIVKTMHPKINKAVLNGAVNLNILEILEFSNNQNSFINSTDIKNTLLKLTAT